MSEIKVTRYRPSHYLLPIGIDTVTTLFVYQGDCHNCTGVLCHGEGNNIFPLLHFGRQSPDSRSAYLPNCHLFLSSLRPLDGLSFAAPIWSLPIPISPNLLQVSSSSTDLPHHDHDQQEQNTLRVFLCEGKGISHVRSRCEVSWDVGKGRPHFVFHSFLSSASPDSC